MFLGHAGYSQITQMNLIQSCKLTNNYRPHRIMLLKAWTILIIWPTASILPSSRSRVIITTLYAKNVANGIILKPLGHVRSSLYR